MQNDYFPSPELQSVLQHRLTTDQHPPLLDPLLQATAGMLLTQFGQGKIKPHASTICWNVQSEAWVCAIIGPLRDEPGTFVDRRCASRLLWILHHA